MFDALFRILGIRRMPEQFLLTNKSNSVCIMALVPILISFSASMTLNENNVMMRTTWGNFPIFPVFFSTNFCAVCVYDFRTTTTNKSLIFFLNYSQPVDLAEKSFSKFSQRKNGLAMPLRNATNSMDYSQWLRHSTFTSRTRVHFFVKYISFIERTHSMRKWLSCAQSTTLSFAFDRKHLCVGFFCS